MSKEKEFDVEQISGYQFMDKEDREYFEKFGFAMSNQAELLAEQYDINSETMSDSFDFLMDSLVYRTNEYIVDGAPLQCSLQTNITQKLTYQDKEIVSEPVEIEEMSTLQLPENRQESVNGLAFANVEDAKGGMRDEKEAIENETDNVNIVSFGNCRCLERDNLTKVEDLAKNVHKILAEKNKEITVAEVEEKIITAIKQGKGTCYCCMWLNPEWENLPVEYDYMMNSFYPELPSAGVSKILESESYMQFGGKEGINMMSMLFCRRSGIISAKESGQSRINSEITGVSSKLVELLKSYETGADVNGNLLANGEPALRTYCGKSDQVNVHTIGWGHVMCNEEEGNYTFSNGTTMNLYALGTEITQTQAEEILMADIFEREIIINEALEQFGISDKVNQNFYDALFLLVYQNGENIFTHKDLSDFLSSENFDLNNEQEIMYQFGEYTNHNEKGSMRRRADELDIIFYGDYERDMDETRYGDIWGKKTNPNSVTKGYE